MLLNGISAQQILDGNRMAQDFIKTLTNYDPRSGVVALCMAMTITGKVAGLTQAQALEAMRLVWNTLQAAEGHTDAVVGGSTGGNHSLMRESDDTVEADDPVWDRVNREVMRRAIALYPTCASWDQALTRAFHQVAGGRDG
jgi:hypothetical protein